MFKGLPRGSINLTIVVFFFFGFSSSDAATKNCYLRRWSRRTWVLPPPRESLDLDCCCHPARVIICDVTRARGIISVGGGHFAPFFREHPCFFIKFWASANKSTFTVLTKGLYSKCAPTEIAKVTTRKPRNENVKSNAFFHARDRFGFSTAAIPKRRNWPKFLHEFSLAKHYFSRVFCRIKNSILTRKHRREILFFLSVLKITFDLFFEQCAHLFGVV